MWTFYFISLIPIIIGMILWILRKEITWQEWIGSAIASIILATFFNFYAISGMTSDIETWSGKITDSRQYSRWHEYYEYAVYRTEYYSVTVTDYCTDSKGNSRRCGSHQETRSRQVFDHWEPTTRWHEAYWGCSSDINTSYNIPESQFIYYVRVFNHKQSIEGNRTTGEHNSKMIGGDPNDYITSWIHNRHIEPVTKTVDWKNKIKAAPSVFSFAKVPTNIMVFNWPENTDPFHSARVLGTAKNKINLYEWDKLNAELGATKKVNLIIIGFNSPDMQMGMYQQAKLIGGKKNDIVITYGGTNEIMWSYTFGWTESELCKRDIDTYIKNNGITTNIYSFLKDEIVKNYTIKDWKKFDYISIEPAARYYWWFLFWNLIIQTGLWAFFFKNDIDKS